MNQTPTPIPPDNLFAMAAATAHADRETPGWTDLAADFLRRYAAEHETFVGEDVTAAARGVIPDPPDARAWGAVLNGASRRGEIVKTGKFKARTNGSPQVEWRTA